MGDKTKIDWCGIQWIAVPGHDGYFASADGKILSTKKKTPSVMKPIKSKDGHLYVFMYDGGKPKKVWLHRAILSAFSGAEQKHLECRHLDDDPANNHINNLEWGTRLQNAADKRRNGGIPSGERSGTHKLTASEVLEIRKEYGKSSSRQLGKKYGVSHTEIRRAALGIKWADL